jgi:Mrp family chromosome partitioning ATPase
MSKLDEVLPQQRVAHLAPTSAVRQGPPRVSTPMRRQLEALYQSLDSSLPGAGKLVGFAASRTGEGTTTIVREFAGFLASTFNAAVLIVDANPNRAVAGRWDADAASLAGLVRALRTRGSPPVKRPGISIVSLLRDMLNMPAGRDDPAELAVLRAYFDYVLFDVPALAVNPSAVSIGGQVDGVVIVVEAERTRWPVVENTKRAYEAAGANVLGVVLNKRRFYIPSRIYTQL